MPGLCVTMTGCKSVPSLFVIWKRNTSEIRPISVFPSPCDRGSRGKYFAVISNIWMVSRLLGIRLLYQVNTDEHYACLVLCSLQSGSIFFLFFFFFLKQRLLFIYFYKLYLFIYFWLCWVFVAAHGLSLVVGAGATLHCGVQASHCGGLSCCGAGALGAWASVVVACGLSSCGARA